MHILLYLTCFAWSDPCLPLQPPWSLLSPRFPFSGSWQHQASPGLGFSHAALSAWKSLPKALNSTYPSNLSLNRTFSRRLSWPSASVTCCCITTSSKYGDLEQPSFICSQIYDGVGLSREAHFCAEWHWLDSSAWGWRIQDGVTHMLALQLGRPLSPHKISPAGLLYTVFGFQEGENKSCMEGLCLEVPWCPFCSILPIKANLRASPDQEEGK